MSDTKFLEISDLCIGYDGKAILNDINFDLTNGSYLCIVGENGAGKSTFLKTISGLLKPVFGNVKFNCTRQEIGYLPQQTAVQLDFPATTMEIVSSGTLSRSSWYRPFYSKEEKERIFWACEKTGIASQANRCFRELSGGQQRRVLLARALVTSKNAVFLDEPTAGLDPDAMKEFYQLLAKLNKDESITILMVTHDVDSAVEHATHILHLFTKKAKENEEADDYFFGETAVFKRGGAG